MVGAYTFYNIREVKKSDLEVEIFYDFLQTCLRHYNMAFQKEKKISNKRQINYEFLKRKKLKKQKTRFIFT